MQSYIWIIANSFTRWLWVPLALHLTKTTGLKTLVLLPSKQDEKFYRAQPGGNELEYLALKDPYDFVIASAPSAFPSPDVAKALAEHEEKLGISVMREMVLPDRHLGRGYMLAGEGHPESQTSKKASFGSTMQACLEQIEFTLALFDKYPPTVILSYYSGGGIKYKPMAAICRAKSIPFRALCPARFGGLVYWADDEYEGSDLISQALGSEGPLPTVEEAEGILRDIAPSALATDPGALRRLRGMSRWDNIIKRAAYLSAQRVYAKIRGYSFGRTGYLLSSQIAHMVRMRKHWRILDRLAVRDLPDISDRKIVYYPLQQEPEASTLVLAPKHSNQLATIMELSLALPPDALLIVKEHIWQIGRRPNWFYKAICRLPNVILVHPEASGIEMIRRADIVATISSSAGFEALALGKQVIFFWEKSPLLSMPQVCDMTRFQGMERLREMLHGDSEAAKQRRRLLGARYLKRLREVCMDLGPMRFFSRSDQPSEDELKLIAGPLFDTGVLKKYAQRDAAGVA